MAMRVVSKTGIFKPSISESHLSSNSPQHNRKERLFRMLLPGCLGPGNQPSLPTPIKSGLYNMRMQLEFVVSVLRTDKRPQFNF